MSNIPYGCPEFNEADYFNWKIYQKYPEEVIGFYPYIPELKLIDILRSDNGYQLLLDILKDHKCWTCPLREQNRCIPETIIPKDEFSIFIIPRAQGNEPTVNPKLQSEPKPTSYSELPLAA